MGRLTEKNASGRTLLSNEYDLNGNRTAMTDLTGKRCEYRYNSLGQLEEITDNGKVQVHYTYNADGTVKRMEAGAGLLTEYAYDADKNVISQKTVMPSFHVINQRDSNKPFTLADNTYTYDTNGNRTGKRTLSGLTSYHYDAAGRLVKADYPTGSEEYRYDRAGNRTAKLVNGIEAEHYSYDGGNRLISHDIMSLRSDGTKVNEHKEYTYDSQGNMLSDGRRSYSYDAMNRLEEVRNTDGSWQRNFYDGEGLRAEMEENGRLVSFLFDGDKVIAETDSDQNTIRYIRGYELISSDSEAAKTYYHYASDEMGSITHITDDEGNILNRYEYDAFGNFTLKEETIENRFGFTGEQYDPVAGLYYLRARFYNPVIGRFIQEDTYYGDGLNLYAYCHNNPVEYVDPSGNACDKKYKKLKKLGLTAEEAYDIMNQAKNVKGSVAKGILVEQLMDTIMKKHGYTQLPSKLNSNNGIDGIYVKYDSRGRITKLVIGEAKFGNSRLGNTVTMGRQMGDRWIQGNINNMRRRGQTQAVKDAGKELYDYINGLGKYKPTNPNFNNQSKGKYQAFILRLRASGYISVKYRQNGTNRYNTWR